MSRHPPRAARRPLPREGLAFALLEAAGLVHAVLAGRNLTEAFERARHLARPAWSDSMRGAIRDLAWRTLRDYGRGDRVLTELLAQRTKPLPDEVRAMLLVALQRLESRPEQAHIVVDQAVEATAMHAPGLKGLVNGVLRNTLRRWPSLAECLDRDPVSRYRHPQWWIDCLRVEHPEHWVSILEQSNRPPPMSVRVNRRRATVEQVRTRLMAAGVSTTRLANDALLLEHALPVSALPGFAEGELSVQDAGAQWAAHWLDPRPGERVLDACAAPGGKSAHLLEWADIALLSLELDPQRAARIGYDFARLGLTAQIQVGDASTPQAWWDGRPFDCILADVPCSASGVARRHPDIKSLRRADDVAGFAQRQQAILDALWSTLAPGGRMLYVTCSLFDAENRIQIEQFLHRHREAQRWPIQGEQDRQLLPSTHHDGFYYALLRKSA